MKPEERLGDLLRTKGWTIGVAESCTGGLLSGRITDVPGASAYFRGAIVAYHNDLKAGLLWVGPDVIRRTGAVSEEVARAMARGCREVLACDVAVAITGIAGPGGGTAEKPVGLVYIAVGSPTRTQSARFLLSGDRSSVRERAVGAALEMVLALLEGD
jgi:PncC family amidohydrolase